MNRLPFWFRQRIPDDITLKAIDLISKLGVNTVCKEARCPNSSYCFSKRMLTFMILGDTCTRNCRFCCVDKSEKRTLTVDANEPFRISQIIKELAIKYAVITSVSRDDLPDAGAAHYVNTIKAIRDLNQDIKIEVLIPDFGGKFTSLRSVVEASVDVVAHNIETVPRLYNYLRPRADYLLSLGILSNSKLIKPSIITKSSLMLGLGETQEEVIQTMKDLKQRKCDIITLGQYLAPSREQVSVKEFVTPEQFCRYRDIALSLGFRAVFSAPLVRSSYKAEEVFKEVSSV